MKLVQSDNTPKDGHAAVFRGGAIRPKVDLASSPYESRKSLSRICPAASFFRKAGRATLPDFGQLEPTRIEQGNYLADVMRGSNAYPFWYYVIRRKNSIEIIDLVKFNSYEQAVAGARELLTKLQLAAKSA